MTASAPQPNLTFFFFFFLLTRGEIFQKTPESLRDDSGSAGFLPAKTPPGDPTSEHCFGTLVTRRVHDPKVPSASNTPRNPSPWGHTRRRLLLGRLVECPGPHPGTHVPQPVVRLASFTAFILLSPSTPEPSPHALRLAAGRSPAFPGDFFFDVLSFLFASAALGFRAFGG